MSDSLFRTLKPIILVALFFCIFSIDYSNVADYFSLSSELEPADYDYWTDDERRLCEDPNEDVTWIFRDSLCFIVIRGFEESRIEVLSWAPPLVIYHELFSKKQVADYLELFHKQELNLMKVADGKGNLFFSTFRKTNGTDIYVDDHPETRSLVATASRHIPTMDLTLTEPIRAFSYHEGGHFALHHDYLDPHDGGTDNDYMRKMGNRFATMIMTFQAAELGGGTMFASFGLVVKTQPGDAFLFFDEKENMEKDPLTDHAGCRVHAGRKIIGTLFVRDHGQPLLAKYYKNQSFNANILLR